MEKVELEVVAGACRLVFEPGWCSGKEPDTNPGVSFILISDWKGIERDGKLYLGMGIIRRSDAAKLRDMLTEFLAENHEGVKNAE